MENDNLLLGPEVNILRNELSDIKSLIAAANENTEEPEPTEDDQITLDNGKNIPTSSDNESATQLPQHLEEFSE
jgi:hypothetical protein